MKRAEDVVDFTEERAIAMTGKEFVNRMANGKAAIIQVFLDILAPTNSRFCIIGGLAAPLPCEA